MYNRKSFFKDRSKLYLIQGKQLTSITEAKATVLFQYLEIKWGEIEIKFKELNKNNAKGERKIPVTIKYDLKTYRILRGSITRDMYMRIGFGLNDVRVIFIEKETIKAIQKFEEKKTAEKFGETEVPTMITVKKASELANKSSATIRNWLKKDFLKFKKTKVGSAYRYLINKQSLEEYIKAIK